MSNITKSGGNVYADIGIPNPEEHAAKASLVMRMAEIMRRDGLTQTEAANRMRALAARRLQAPEGAVPAVLA